MTPVLWFSTRFTLQLYIIPGRKTRTHYCYHCLKTVIIGTASASQNIHGIYSIHCIHYKDLEW